jgi:hypothetical protein
MGIQHMNSTYRKGSSVNNSTTGLKVNSARGLTTRILAGVGAISIVASAFLMITLVANASAAQSDVITSHRTTTLESIFPSPKAPAPVDISSQGSALKGALVISEAPVLGPLDAPTSNVSNSKESKTNLNGAIKIAPTSTGGPIVVSFGK